MNWVKCTKNSVFSLTSNISSGSVKRASIIIEICIGLLRVTKSGVSTSVRTERYKQLPEIRLGPGPAKIRERGFSAFVVLPRPYTCMRITVYSDS